MKRTILSLLRALLPSGVAMMVLMVGVSAPAVANQMESDGPLQISWDASDSAPGTAESFFGMPIVVPGDSARRSLTVRNAGPSGGTLTARIVNVELAGTDTGASFYDDLEIHWADGSASMRELYNNGETEILQEAMVQGVQTEVALEYLFPRDAASGNYANSPSHQASFDVEFQINGDLPDGGAASDDGRAFRNSGSAAFTQGSAGMLRGPALTTQPGTGDSVATNTHAETTGPDGNSDQSGITVPLGAPDETNDTTESAAERESRLDTGQLVLVGAVQNWPILITAILVGVGWAAMRGFRTRPRAY